MPATRQNCLRALPTLTHRKARAKRRSAEVSKTSAYWSCGRRAAPTSDPCPFLAPRQRPADADQWGPTYVGATTSQPIARAADAILWS